MMNDQIDAKKINDHLSSGGVVQITTYLKSTLYKQRHAGWFTTGTDGELYVNHGRGKNCLTSHKRPLVSIRLGRVVAK